MSALRRVSFHRWRPSAPARDHGLALLLYGALALLLVWPLPLHLATAYPAAPGEGAQDLWQNLWNLWWAGEALQRGVNPFFTDVLFYPRGASLLFHPLNLTGGALALPLRALAGPVAAYNGLVLLSFVLSGYAVFLLARFEGCASGAAFAGGVIYTAAAYHFFHLRLGHLEQLSMQWLPLYALALGALLRRPTARRVLATALALLLVIFTSLYMALYAGVLMLVALTPSPTLRAGPRPPLPLRWERGRTGERGRTTARATRKYLALGAALLLALMVAGPLLLVPMIREARQSNYMIRSEADAARGSAAPADALLPPVGHPLRRVLALPAPRSGGSFLGYIPLALALYALARLPHRAGRWLALALLAWLLSLGPALPLYRLLYTLPPLQAARYPDRFALLVQLGVAMAAAFGADALLQRVQMARAIPGLLASRRTLIAILLAGLLLELAPGVVPLTAPIDNPFYHILAREPGRSSVLELPLNRVNNLWADMAAQTIHERPILHGALARDVPRIPYERMPLIRELERPDAPRDIVAQADRATALRYLDLRYLVYHRFDENGPVVPPSPEALAQAAGVPVSQIYADDRLAGFRLELPDGPRALPPIAALGEGWYNLEPAGAERQRWLRPEGGAIHLYAADAATAGLRIRMLAYIQPRHLDVYLDDRAIARIEAQPWPTEASTPPFELNAGAHMLRLVPVEPGVSPRMSGQGDDERPLTVAVFELEVR